MPAVNEIDIANMALDLLVEGEIFSLSEDTKSARLLNRHYETTRQSELKKHAWAFAIFRASLVKVATASLPVGDNAIYPYGYNVPTDALRVLPLTEDGEAHSPSIPWKQEGSLILTSWDSPRLIRYIGNMTDPDDWDSLFTEALAARLAFKIALPLTGKEMYVKVARLAYDEAIADARRMNLIESGSVARSQSWAEARGDTPEWR